MNPQIIQIGQVPSAVGASLSALTPVGDDFWLGADEGTSLVRANAQGGGTNGEWAAVGAFDLIPLLDLPGNQPKKKKKPSDPDEFPEADVEGMASDGHHLWIVGSHSLKRKQPEDDKEDEKNFERLNKVEADGNRYLLGRLPLDEQGDLLNPGAATAEHCAARLPCDLFGSTLLDELRNDSLLARFVPASGKDSEDRNIPGKDNGLDIEGLAAVGPNQLLVGLRGPVLRSWALVLELRLASDAPPGGDKPATLHLQSIGAKKYRRLAFQLGGLGIRDLCFDENGDLLILAGPTMVLPWPVTVFRWRGARELLSQDTDDHFIWPSELHEELTHVVSAGDRAESICVIGSGPGRRLVVGYDNPDRLTGVNPAIGTGTLSLDSFPFI